MSVHNVHCSMVSSVQTAYAASEGIHVALAPYIVGNAFGIPISAPLITTWITMAILIIGAFLVGRSLSAVPGKMQNASEMVIGGVYDYVSSVLERPALARTYFPIIMTIFLFILVFNWIGLLPGVTSIGYYPADNQGLIPFFYHPATDLNISIGFAIVAFFTIELAGILSIGIVKYGKKFINFSSPLNFLIGIIELISELARLVSFSFRLFGNIFAGKVLILVVIFFLPYVVPVPLIGFELFVGFIQAFIFAILTLFFIKVAITEVQPH